MNNPTPQTTAAWVALVRAHKQLLDAIEDNLKTEQLPKLAWYDVLWEIEKTGSAGIRPYELLERLLLPQYGMSRLLERMAKEGLITRTEVETDGRGQVIHLTAKGREIRAEMWSPYAAVLTTDLEDRLSGVEQKELARLLNKLTTR